MGVKAEPKLGKRSHKCQKIAHFFIIRVWILLKKGVNRAILPWKKEKYSDFGMEKRSKSGCFALEKWKIWL